MLELLAPFQTTILIIVSYAAVISALACLALSRSPLAFRARRAVRVAGAMFATGIVVGAPVLFFEFVRILFEPDYEAWFPRVFFGGCLASAVFQATRFLIARRHASSERLP